MIGPRRILIIGPSGAGKSTLARLIGAKLGLPVIHLDALYWGPNWTPCDEAMFRQTVAEKAAGEAWVMDGNYPQTMHVRLQRAEAVIWLDLPRRVYFARALWRSVKGFGRDRPDIGNKERFDPAFFTDWVWTYPKRRHAHLALMADLPHGVLGITLRSRRDVRRLIDSMPQCFCFDG